VIQAFGAKNPGAVPVILRYSYITRVKIDAVNLQLWPCHSSAGDIFSSAI
jgi:hypothetical protein